MKIEYKIKLDVETMANLNSGKTLKFAVDGEPTTIEVIGIKVGIIYKGGNASLIKKVDGDDDDE